jgi:hypothetical protein
MEVIIKKRRTIMTRKQILETLMLSPLFWLADLAEILTTVERLFAAMQEA